MTTNIERELKLQAPTGFSLARLPHNLKPYVASPAHFERLHTVYYDTADYRLMRWGCSLRYRGGEGWTLKLPLPDANKALTRAEYVFQGDPQNVPQAALDLATAYLRGAPVARVAELRTLRTKREMRSNDGEALAEVVEDDVRVIDGTHVERRFHQVEIELEDNARDDTLDTIAAILRHEGAGPPDATPKNVVAAGDEALHPELDTPRLDCNAHAIDVVRAALTDAVTRIVRCDAKLRASDDPEAVHQARVAVRRLRSHLQSFLPLLDPQWACGLRDRLRGLQDAFANTRDADVLAAHIEALADELPPTEGEHACAIVERLKQSARDARDALLRELRSREYVELLDVLVDGASRPHALPQSDAPAADVGPGLIENDYRALRKRVKRAGRCPSDRQLHRIRIRAKRLRYNAESFADVLGRRAADLAAAAEALQTVLGEQHDSVVAVRRMHELAETPEGFVAGELAALARIRGLKQGRRWNKTWRTIRRRHDKLIN